MNLELTVYSSVLQYSKGRVLEIEIQKLPFRVVKDNQGRQIGMVGTGVLCIHIPYNFKTCPLNPA